VPLDTFTTGDLILYSSLTHYPIGHALDEPSPIVEQTNSFIGFAQFVTFSMDSTDEQHVLWSRWRRPLEGHSWWQFHQIKNNGGGIVTVECVHINSVIVPGIYSVHVARVGGSISGGQLLPASEPLVVAVKQTFDPVGYELDVNLGQFTFQFNPDELTPSNADEIDFETGL
jgi:hypothetical protein